LTGIAKNEGNKRRLKTKKAHRPGKWEMVEPLVDLDPQLFLGKVGSAFTRPLFSELASVSSGGGMAPKFIIDEK